VVPKVELTRWIGGGGVFSGEDTGRVVDSLSGNVFCLFLGVFPSISESSLLCFLTMGPGNSRVAHPAAGTGSKE